MLSRRWSPPPFCNHKGRPGVGRRYRSIVVRQPSPAAAIRARPRAGDRGGRSAWRRCSRAGQGNVDVRSVRGTTPGRPSRGVRAWIVRRARNVSRATACRSATWARLHPGRRTCRSLRAPDLPPGRSAHSGCMGPKGARPRGCHTATRVPGWGRSRIRRTTPVSPRERTRTRSRRWCNSHAVRVATQHTLRRSRADPLRCASRSSTAPGGSSAPCSGRSIPRAASRTAFRRRSPLGRTG
jgi:hypothetical protein